MINKIKIEKIIGQLKEEVSNNLKSQGKKDFRYLCESINSLGLLLRELKKSEKIK